MEYDREDIVTDSIFSVLSAPVITINEKRRLTMITVEHLTKRYGEFTAVNDLSFEIEEGHVYGFLGPKGA